MTLTPGSRLGPYETVAVIGSGGMGEVYRATDTRLEREVAIKLLAGEFRSNEDLRERLAREARAVARLSHPHICALYDVGREGDRDFLVMSCSPAGPSPSGSRTGRCRSTRRSGSE
jgi:serine/threonine protein kinase